MNTNSPRSHPDTSAVNRTTRHGTEQRQTEHVSGRIPAALRIELDRIAKENGWSESYAVRVAIQEFIENTIEQSLGKRVEAIVVSAIERAMQKRENREAKLLSRIYRALEEFRCFTDKVLARLFPGEVSALQRLQLEAKKDTRVTLSHASKEGDLWPS